MVTWENEIKQIEDPYYCTIAYERFLQKHGCFVDGKEILDIGTGVGAAIHYFRQWHPGSRFVGVDYNPEKIRIAKELAKQNKLEGADFDVSNWMNLPESFVNRFDGVTTTHSLVCLKQIEPSLQKVFDLKPRWFSANALFFDGPLDVLIHIRDHDYPILKDDDPDGDFNIFSLPKSAEFCKQNGYEMTYEPFHPPQDIPKPKDAGRGTYTMKTEIHDRTQFSGPVFLPWYFVLAMKTE